MIMSLLLVKTVSTDSPIPWGISLQDIASPIGEGLSEFHNIVIFYLSLITVGVLWLLWCVAVSDNKFSHKYLTHGTLLELIWTITPAILLVAIAYPSFKLLYLIDENVSAALTVKVIGRQWYWSVEYCDYFTNSALNGINGTDVIDVTDGTVIEPVAFDVYIVPTDELTDGGPRLLAVDNSLVVPVNTNINFIVTGADVIHDFAVPSLGIKVDAIPGRLNQAAAFINRTGRFFGQCSELCGSGHGFIPICVEAVSMDKYLTWLSSQQ